MFTTPKFSAALLACIAGLAACHGRYGIENRIVPQPYLGMPQNADGAIPALLSQTGVLKDAPKLTPADGLLSYEIRVPFWSYGANKLRWVSVPAAKIGFAPTGEWTFPAGVVFVKTFELPVDDAPPTITGRIETRLLGRDATGGVYGVVYKWRADNSDADLLTSGVNEEIPIRTADGGTRSQTWYYPSREDCLKCHNSHAGGVLGRSAVFQRSPNLRGDLCWSGFA